MSGNNKLTSAAAVVLLFVKKIRGRSAFFLFFSQHASAVTSRFFWVELRAACYSSIARAWGFIGRRFRLAHCSRTGGSSECEPPRLIRYIPGPFRLYVNYIHQDYFLCFASVDRTFRETLVPRFFTPSPPSLRALPPSLPPLQNPPIVYALYRAKLAEPWGARLTLALVACLYGTNYTAIKYVGDFLDTPNLLALRFGLAGITLLPALRGVGRDVLLAGAEVGVFATLGYTSQAYAMRVR